MSAATDLLCQNWYARLETENGFNIAFYGVEPISV